ncbi:MAG: single-stranded DNA-binding protein [Candidatus Pacebacteria bacterium]|nr:single-stranded DNA-binding protein [Candidatus Paceibacterota bacterium]PIR60013.1 MAG: single-stranded DNA-binding protein [Candidatus Pacebacteria bacterium CG10_big_fil_rev_8_21_14_0_10_44_54]
MATRSLNKVMLIGNLTRDPNLRYTPNSTAVCSFSIATNSSWTPRDGGEKQERVEYHNIVAWSKLADICGQLLHKGDKVFVEGRLQTRDWKGEDGVERRTTEIVLENMLLLQSRSGGGSQPSANDNYGDDDDDVSPPKAKTSKKSTKKQVDAPEEAMSAEDIADDVPF